jgi:hypothetical protein
MIESKKLFEDLKKAETSNPKELSVTCKLSPFVPLAHVFEAISLQCCFSRLGSDLFIKIGSKVETLHGSCSMIYLASSAE